MANACLKEMHAERQHELEIFISRKCPQVLLPNIFSNYHKVAETMQRSVVVSAIEALRKMAMGEDLYEVMEPLHEDHAVRIYGYMMANEVALNAVELFDCFLERLIYWLRGDNMDNLLYQCTREASFVFIKNQAIYSFFVSLRNIIKSINVLIAVASVNGDEDFDVCRNRQIPYVDPKVLLEILEDVENNYLDRTNIPIYCPDNNIKAMVYRLRFMVHLEYVLHHIKTVINDEPNNNVINDLFREIDLAKKVLLLVKNSLPRFGDNDESMYTYLKRLMNRLFTACGVLLLRDYERSLNFFSEFSHFSYKCVLTRSIAQLLFLNNRDKVVGNFPMKKFFYDSVYCFTLSPALDADFIKHFGSTLKLQLDKFFTTVSRSGIFVEFIRIFGYSVRRQRNKVEHLIGSIASMYAKANNVDYEIMKMNHTLVNLNGSDNDRQLQLVGKNYFSQWIRAYGLRATYLYLTLGIICDSYYPEEYISVYFYMSNYLFDGQEFMWQTIINSHTYNEENRENTQVDKYQGEEMEQEQLEILKIRPKFFDRWTSRPKKDYFQNQLVMLNVLKYMSCGLYKGMSGLIKAGRLARVSNDISSYRKIFKSFSRTTARPLNEVDFIEERDLILEEPLIEIYKMAAVEFEGACKALECLKSTEKEDLLVIARKNFIVMKLLASGHRENATTPVGFDFAHNQFYPVFIV